MNESKNTKKCPICSLTFLLPAICFAPPLHLRNQPLQLEPILESDIQALPRESIEQLRGSFQYREHARMLHAVSSPNAMQEFWEPALRLACALDAFVNGNGLSSSGPFPKGLRTTHEAAFRYPRRVLARLASKGDALRTAILQDLSSWEVRNGFGGGGVGAEELLPAGAGTALYCQEEVRADYERRVRADEAQSPAAAPQASSSSSSSSSPTSSSAASPPTDTAKAPPSDEEAEHAKQPIGEDNDRDNMEEDSKDVPAASSASASAIVVEPLIGSEDDAAAKMADGNDGDSLGELDGGVPHVTKNREVDD